MSAPVPRELLNVLVDVDRAGTITTTFDLGDPFPPDLPAEWFTHGVALTDDRDALTKHFVARLSPTETKAFVYEFSSNTEANYDASPVQDRGTSVVARFPDASLGTSRLTSAAGFGTVEGEDVSADVPVQVL